LDISTRGLPAPYRAASPYQRNFAGQMPARQKIRGEPATAFAQQRHPYAAAA